MQGLNTQLKCTGTVHMTWKIRGAQWEQQYGQLKEMLPFQNGLTFLKLSAASPETKGFRNSSTQSVHIASF